MSGVRGQRFANLYSLLFFGISVVEICMNEWANTLYTKPKHRTEIEHTFKPVVQKRTLYKSTFTFSLYLSFRVCMRD